jgi:hypothetical protein
MTTDNERKERAVLDSMPQTVLEARRQLTAMGLQYFNQEQFLAAMERNDKLAVKLFIIGRGVKLRK